MSLKVRYQIADYAAKLAAHSQRFQLITVCFLGPPVLIGVAWLLFPILEFCLFFGDHTFFGWVCFLGASATIWRSASILAYSFWAYYSECGFSLCTNLRAILLGF